MPSKGTWPHGRAGDLNPTSTAGTCCLGHRWRVWSLLKSLFQGTSLCLRAGWWKHLHLWKCADTHTKRLLVKPLGTKTNAETQRNGWSLSYFMGLFSESFILARDGEGKETIWTEFDYLFVLFYQGKPRLNQQHGMNIFKTLVTRARKPS